MTNKLWSAPREGQTNTERARDRKDVVQSVRTSREVRDALEAIADNLHVKAVATIEAEIIDYVVHLAMTERQPGETIHYFLSRILVPEVSIKRPRSGEGQ